jgi:two-component system cell cycle sensor histidine kinase/response regulator CckA
MTTSIKHDPAADLSTSVSSPLGTILLVEDDPMVSEIVSQLIVSLGYNVLPAASAEEAVLEFQKHQECIDVLLTDHLMPAMDGPELAEVLHQINPEIKVILMSGRPPDALPEGQTICFLQKPFSRDELACKLAEVMQQSPSAALPQATEDPALHRQPIPAR